MVEDALVWGSRDLGTSAVFTIISRTQSPLKYIGDLGGLNNCSTGYFDWMEDALGWSSRDLIICYRSIILDCLLLCCQEELVHHLQLHTLFQKEHPGRVEDVVLVQSSIQGCYKNSAAPSPYQFLFFPDLSHPLNTLEVWEDQLVVTQKILIGWWRVHGDGALELIY